MADQQVPDLTVNTGQAAATQPTSIPDLSVPDLTVKNQPAQASVASSGIPDLSVPDLTQKTTKVPDSSQTWIGKAWDWANTPLVNIHDITGATGGFGQGAEDVASGFTSPLSIGLTVGSLGAGALFRGLGIAENVAVKGVQALLDAGFTGQQAYQAIHESPRVLDAIKDGDYETAKRLGVSVLAGGVFAGLSARHTLHDAGEFAEATGIKNKPSAQVQKAREQVRSYKEAEQLASSASKVQEKLYRGKLDDALKGTSLKRGPELDHAMMATRELRGNKDDIASMYNSVAESAGRTDRLPTTVAPDPRIQQLTQRGLVKENYKPKEVSQLLDGLKLAHNGLPQPALDVVKAVGDSQDQLYEFAHQNNILNSYVDDHVRRIWEPEKNPAANQVLHEANAGRFSTTPSFARKRVFDSTLEGILLGRKLKTADIIGIDAADWEYARRSAAARDMLDNIRDKDVVASDGRPAVVVSGAGKPITDVDGNTLAVAVRPEKIRSQKISDNKIQQLTQSGDLQRFLDDETIHVLNPDAVAKGKAPVYGWSTRGYVDLDHPAFKKWIYAARAEGLHNTVEGPQSNTPIYVHGDMMVHPEFKDYLKQQLGLEQSGLAKSKVGGAVLKAGTEAKHLLLSFSPFHIAQEGLRAVMTGINPIGWRYIDPNYEPNLAKLIHYGMTYGQDSPGLQKYTEGLAAHSKLISKVPVIGKLQDSMQHFLFDKYIPNLKARAGESLLERYKGAYPNLSEEELYTKVAQHTNNIFGGQNYAELGRSVAAQDFARLVALAPDWLESELRSFGGLFGKNPAIYRQDFLRMAAYMWAGARVLNMLTTGEMHHEAPFGVVTKDKSGKEKVYSMRSLPTDMLHLATDPAGFIRGRFSPLARTSAELYSGRDQQGKRLTPGDLFLDTTSNLLPIPVQSSIKSRPDITNVDQAIKATGGTVMTYKTEAEKLASQLASDRSESGPIDREKLAAHQMKIQFSDDIRNGRMNPKDIYDMVHTGQLPLHEAKTIIKESEMTSLQARFSKLPMKDALQVYNAGTDREKAELSKELLKKRNNYVKNALKNETPGQRVTDPVYKQLRVLFPEMPPW